jgi:hypothetical protein
MLSSGFVPFLGFPLGIKEKIFFYPQNSGLQKVFHPAKMAEIQCG